MKKPLLIKIAVGVLAVGVFAFLFARSLSDTRAAPYTVPAHHLERWTLALVPASSPGDPFLVLQPPAELTSGLFKQIFSRAMESLNTPLAPAIPLVLRGEFDRVVGERLTEDALLAAARAAGIETAPAPRCVVHRYVSEPGVVRQVFFVYFESPVIVRFRQQLGLDPQALSPILFVAGAGAEFNSWLPQRVDPDADCLAPVAITS